MLGYDGIPECYYASGVKYDEVNALTEKAIETRNAFMLATTAKQRATGFELPVCLRATETAPPDELCSMLPATTSLAIGTRDVGTHARDTSEASEDYACYICLDESGPMLVNVCACRSMRVHSHCLMELIFNFNWLFRRLVHTYLDVHTNEHAVGSARALSTACSFV